MVQLQIEAAVRSRRYLGGLVDGIGPAPEAHARWREWTRDYESIWTTVVTNAMKAGVRLAI
jgi:hypothetical protein